MKNRNFGNALPLAILAGGLLQGCAYDFDFPDPLPTQPRPDDKDTIEYFDFKTDKDITLNVNYGPYAANALLSVYLAYPYKEDGEHILTVREADYKIFADDGGCFSGQINLPSYADSLWIEAGAMGMPLAQPVKVKNGVATFDYTAIGSDETRSVGTRAVVNYTDQYPGSLNNDKYRIRSFVKWNNKTVDGRIDNYKENSGLLSKGTISGDDMLYIRKTFWQGKENKPKWMCDVKDRLNNSNLFYDNINTVVIKDSKVYVTFLTEETGQLNSLGYYFYKTGETPTAQNGLADVDKYIIIPNASMISNGTAGAGAFSTYSKDQEKKRVQLLFVDPDTKEVKDEFPAGYTIGFFSLIRGYNSKNGNDRLTLYSAQKVRGDKDDSHKGILYTNHDWNFCPWERAVFSSWNQDCVKDNYWGYSNLNKGFVSLKVADGVLLYGMEDCFDDLGYEDLLFAVEGTGIDTNDGRPELPRENTETYTTEVTYRTYAYEDQWPKRGDYDLNDVVILHKREIMFSSKNNQIVKITDTFSPIQPEGAAGYNNAFAIRFSQDGGGAQSESETKCAKTEYEGDVKYEDATKSHIVFTSAKAQRGKEFKIVRTFNAGVSKDRFNEKLDPYIIAQYDKNGGQGRTEVHLPGYYGYYATSYGNDALIGTGDDAGGTTAFIDKDGKFPFAISIPVNQFAPASEGTRIDKVYPKYVEWANSKGTKCTDWYYYRN